MSTLTEVVLYVTCVRNDKLEADIKALDFGFANRSGQRFNRLNTDTAGGSKFFCCQVYAACFNYVSPEEVKAGLELIDWQYYDAVAIIDHENSDGLEIWRNKE